MASGGGKFSKAMTLLTMVLAWAKVSTGKRPMPKGGTVVAVAPGWNWPNQMSPAFRALSQLLVWS